MGFEDAMRGRGRGGSFLGEDTPDEDVVTTLTQKELEALQKAASSTVYRKKPGRGQSAVAGGLPGGSYFTPATKN